MKAQPQSQQSETLVDQALRVMHESKKLIGQREAQARQMEQFVEQRGAIANELLRDTGIRATPLWIACAPAFSRASSAARE